MSTYDIPNDHLLHVIDHVLSVNQGRRDELRNLCQSRDAGERAEFFDAVNALQPGLLEQLQSTWAFQTRRSVHLWISPALGDLTPDTSLEAIKDRRGGRHAGGALLYRAPARASKAPEDGDDVAEEIRETARVACVRVTSERELDLEVRIAKPISYTFEEQRLTDWRTTDVPIMIDLSRSERLVEVYAGYNDARKALITFMEWWNGTAVPRRGERQKLFFKPLPFTEGHVKALAKQLKMPNVSIRGMDPKGEVGDQQFWGKPKGPDLAPLDTSLERVRAQDKVPNKERWYGFSHAHPDGFQETTEVAFNFMTKQPRTSFNRRTSRRAITALLSELCTVVGPVV